MAKSRRKAGGATSGRYKPKKMGKGWSSYRAKLGFRPPVKGKDVEPADAAETAAQKADAPKADAPKSDDE